jgi:hypothetical protein
VSAGEQARRELTPRQLELRNAVREFAGQLTDQLMIVGVIATKLGCSSADIAAVREVLLTPFVRECGDLRG